MWQKLWFLLDKHHTPPLHGEEQMISYQDFLLVAAEAGSKCKSVPYFCPLPVGTSFSLLFSLSFNVDL